MEFKKGQGMFEYVLLLAGILLIVVLAIVLLRGGLFGGAEKDAKITNCKAALSRLSACYDQVPPDNWAEANLVKQPDACKTVIPYDDAGGSNEYDNATAGDGFIKCGPNPGS